MIKQNDLFEKRIPCEGADIALQQGVIAGLQMAVNAIEETCLKEKLAGVMLCMSTVSSKMEGERANFFHRNLIYLMKKGVELKDTSQVIFDPVENELIIRDSKND